MNNDIFSKSKHVWLHVRDLQMHPIIQRKFHQRRAQELADTFDPDSIGEITVSKNDAGHFILDGQHRCKAVELALGLDQLVPCRLYEGLTVEQEAKLFLGLNNSKAIRALDIFKLALVARRPVETAIKTILDAHKLRVGETYSPGMVRCPAALIAIYSHYGEATLQSALAVIGDAWGRLPDAYDGVILRAVARLLHAFSTAIDHRDLSRKLARSGGPSMMLGAARDHAKTMSITIDRAAAARMMNIYNKGRRDKFLVLNAAPRGDKRVSPSRSSSIAEP